MNPYLALKHKVHIYTIESSDFDHLISKGDPKKVFIIENNYVWLRDGQHIPVVKELKSWQFQFLHNRQYAILLGDYIFLSHSDRPIAGLKKTSLRSVLDSLGNDVLQTLMVGSQLIQWCETTRFCQQCSGLLNLLTADIVKVCGTCKTQFYPTFQPIVIGLVKRVIAGKTELLLARGLPPREHYSCVAGHLEPGESLEACLHREVFEEVGVQIKNIQYFGSQIWPFPNQLMLGFIADWESGEIHPDPNEISDAGWYSPDKLPLLPPKISIARRMIDHILAQ